MFEKKGILNCGQFYTVCCVLMFEKEGILNFDLYIPRTAFKTNNQISLNF
jgi:hypothetical protein